MMNENSGARTRVKSCRDERVRPVAAIFLMPLVLGIVLLTAARPVFSADPVVKVFLLRHISAEAAAEKIRPLLSHGGAVSVYRPSNSLIVNDVPRVIEKVEAAVKTLDSLPEQIEIQALQISDREFLELGVRVNWRKAGGSWGFGSIQGADLAGVRVSIARLVERVRVRGGMVTSVNVLPGESAAIWIQRRHQAPALLRRYLVRQNYLHSVSPFEEAGTGLSLSPSLIEDKGIRLRIVPRVGYRTGEDQAYLDIAEASTAMSAPEDRWFVLSGGAATGRDVLSILFSPASAKEGRGGINILMKLRQIR